MFAGDNYLFPFVKFHQFIFCVAKKLWILNEIVKNDG